MLIPGVEFFSFTYFLVGLFYLFRFLLGDEPGEEFLKTVVEVGTDLEVDEDVRFEDFDLHVFDKFGFFWGMAKW